MKNVIVLLLLIYFLPVSGQSVSIVGSYKGEINTDSVSIVVTFDIKKDSTYKITIAYDFTEYCVGKGKDLWLFEGKWSTEENWVFLHPYSKGTAVFYQYEQRSKKVEEMIARNPRVDTEALEFTY